MTTNGDVLSQLYRNATYLMLESNQYPGSSERRTNAWKAIEDYFYEMEVMLARSSRNRGENLWEKTK